MAEDFADAILVLSGVAVTQLPEPDEPRSKSGNTEWYEDSWYVRPDQQGIHVVTSRDHLKPGASRRFASALLAAAVLAERGES